MVDQSGHDVRSRRLESWAQVGSRVATARIAAGFTQQVLADRLALHRSAVTRIEQGKRQLGVLELVRLAEALGRPVDWFVTAAPDAIVSHRRADSDDENVTRLEDQLELVARDIELLREIGELRAVQSRLDVGIDNAEDAEASAVAARELVGLSEGPVHGLQEHVENVGLFAFSLALGPSVIDGGYVRVSDVGAAVVNGAADSGRRRFSLAHELGHHLFADEYSTDFAIGQARQDRERLINIFAVHFLMPRSDVMRRWEELRSAGYDDRAAVVVIAAQYRVSWSAACTHIRNLGLIDRATFDRLSAHRPTRVDYIELRVDWIEELQPVAIPPGFARAVLGAYRRYKIGQDRAIELLRGTIAEAELPEPDDLPMDALRSDFTDS